MSDRPGQEYLDAAFGVQEKRRLAYIEEAKAKKGEKCSRESVAAVSPLAGENEPHGPRRMCATGHVQKGEWSDRCKVKVGDPRGRECGLPIGWEPVVSWCGCERGVFVDGWCSHCGEPEPPRARTGETGSVREKPHTHTGQNRRSESAAEYARKAPQEHPISPSKPQVRGTISRGQANRRQAVRPPSRRGGRLPLTDAHRKRSAQRRRDQDRERKRRARAKLTR